ncbi:MAG: acyl-CoA dehydrogenase [Streptosporangiales bacterium]|nr:acyl-CoA dehydrogenase [Streptosporangiales bacterium]
MTVDHFLLPPEHRLLRDTVRTVAEAEIAPHAARADESGEFPRASLDALVRNRLHAVHLPEPVGGEGADALASCLVVEEVARACATTSLVPAVNKVATLPLLLAGSEEQRKRYLPPVATDGALFSYALSEPDAGSDTSALRTRAVRDGDHYVLNGAKRWITHAGIATYYTVLAVTDPDRGMDGISAFVVEASDPGVVIGRRERKMGLRSSPTCEVLFEDCRIPCDRLIGAPGTGMRTALRALGHSRVAIAAQAVGIAQGALDHARRSVTQRVQFGRPIGDFQGIRFMLADMAMQLEAARQLTYAAAARSDHDSADLACFSSAAKCYASDTAMSVTTDAVQLLGGDGYTRDHPVERMMRDAKVTQIYEGTNQIQRLVLAKHVLS